MPEPLLDAPRGERTLDERLPAGRGATPRTGTATAPSLPPPPSLSTIERLAFRVLLVGSWLLRALPDRPVYRAAYAIGAGLYLLQPRRRALARRNLRRVCRWLVEHDMASPRVALAAREERALERIVRATFGHWLVGYAEAAMAPRYSGTELERRFVAADAATSAETIRPRAPGEVGLIHTSLHFGSVDLSALYGSRVGALPLTGPMEVVEAPLGRAYFEHVRAELDVTIVPVDQAAEALVAALERGEAVGLVADRNIVGRGARVELFGAPVRLPIGPAVLAHQTGAPLYLQAIERTGPGEWLGHTVRLPTPRDVSRREAVRVTTEAQAREFERIIARAPEQWTTLFFPIWEDGEEA